MHKYCVAFCEYGSKMFFICKTFVSPLKESLIYFYFILVFIVGRKDAALDDSRVIYEHNKNILKLLLSIFSLT